MRLFQPKGYTCMHLHSITPSQTDIQDKAVRYYIYFPPPLSFFDTSSYVWAESKLLYKMWAWNMAGLKALWWINISHIYIHMFIPQSPLFFTWTHFTVCITIHMQAARILFIHQSTLDSALFFSLAVRCVLNAKYPAFSSWNSPSCQNLELNSTCLGGPL